MTNKQHDVKLDTDASAKGTGDGSANRSLKGAWWVLMLGVAAGFVKGVHDIKTAIESGESAQGVVMGALPMYLLGACALLMLIKIYPKSGTSEQQAEDTDNRE